MYDKQVKKYLDVFGYTNVKIIIFEEMEKNTKEIVADLLKFLDVNSITPENISKVYHSYAGPKNKLSSSIITNKGIRKITKKLLPRNLAYSIMEKAFIKKGNRPELASEEKEFLAELFKDDISKLEESFNVLIRTVVVEVYTVMQTKFPTLSSAHTEPSSTLVLSLAIILVVSITKPLGIETSAFTD